MVTVKIHSITDSRPILQVKFQNTPLDIIPCPFRERSANPNCRILEIGWVDPNLTIRSTHPTAGLTSLALFRNGMCPCRL